MSGFIARLFTDRLKLEPFPADLAFRLTLLTILTYAAAIAVLGVTLWTLRATRQRQAVVADRTSVSYALGFSATLAAGIFVLPSAWLHYMVLMLLPLATALYALQQHGTEWWAETPRRTLWAIALVSAGAVLLTFGNIWTVYDRVNQGGVWKLVLSYKLYGAVALWAGLLLLNQMRAESAEC